MTPEVFENYRNSAILHLEKKDITLSDETGRIEYEVSRGSHMFDRNQRSVAILKTLTHADLLGVVSDYIVAGAPKRAKITVQVSSPVVPIVPLGNAYTPTTPAQLLAQLNAAKAAAPAAEKYADKPAATAEGDEEEDEEDEEDGEEAAAGGDSILEGLAKLKPASAPPADARVEVIASTAVPYLKDHLPLWPARPPADKHACK